MLVPHSWPKDTARRRKNSENGIAEDSDAEHVTPLAARVIDRVKRDGDGDVLAVEAAAVEPASEAAAEKACELVATADCEGNEAAVAAVAVAAAMQSFITSARVREFTETVSSVAEAE